MMLVMASSPAKVQNLQRRQSKRTTGPGTLQAWDPLSNQVNLSGNIKGTNANSAHGSLRWESYGRTQLVFGH